jgi:hypothetical protein
MLTQATKSFTNVRFAAESIAMSRTIGAIPRGITIKSNLVLLLTRDLELEQQTATAAAVSGARFVLARIIGEALEIIDERSRELDLVVVDYHKTGIPGVAGTPPRNGATRHSRVVAAALFRRVSASIEGGSYS